jgi:threonine dehydratase
MSSILKKTPLEFCQRLSLKYNCHVYLKREDLQTVRSFKIRGAFNKISKYYSKGNNFVTASAGNHAQGVASACHHFGVKSHIFIPENTPLQKIDRIKYFGNGNCNLQVIGNNFNETLKYSLEFSKKNDYIFVHPFDDQDIIEGQGSISNEIKSEITPDIIISCVGGGGLIAGLIKNKIENCDIIGVEPEGAASMSKSLKKNNIIDLNKIDTFVDGASIPKVGNLTFEACKQAKDIITVSNGLLCSNMIDLYQNEGIITEPAGCLSVSGLENIDANYLNNKKVVCIISGGNNDLLRYPEIIENSLRYKQLKHYFIIKFKQKPGELKKYVEKILTPNSDITRFEYIKKNNRYAGTVLIGIELSQKEDINLIKQNMSQCDFQFIEITQDDLLLNYLV